MYESIIDKLNKHSFSRFAKTYDQWALPQRQVARQLIEMSLMPPVESKVLDAGCGTGFLTRELLNRDKSLNITGLDLSGKMLQIYSAINNSTSQQALESLNYRDNTFHSVFSSFTLHWTELALSIKELLRVSQVYYNFAIPIKGSLKLLPFQFPDENEILELIQKYSASIIKSEIQDIYIPFTGIDLIKYFHYTGTTKSDGQGLKGKSFLKNWIEKLETERSYFRILYVQGEIHY